MSNTVQGLVYDNSPFEDDRQKVLLALADAANDDGHAYVSVPKLARKARVSLSNTKLCIRKLESEKVGNSGETMLRVIRHRQKGLCNDYFINTGLLQTLPYYWPPYLRKVLGDARVQRLTPRKRDKNPVGNPPEKGSSGGKDRGQVGGKAAGSLGPAAGPLPHDHVPRHASPHDHASPISHDGPDTVEIMGEEELGGQRSLFTTVEDALDLVQDVAGGVPRGGRWVRDEQTDPGGWSSVEVLAAYKEMVPRTPTTKDKEWLDTIARLGFSTQLTIYLMQAAKRKAKSPPGSMNYFLVAFQKLWADIQHCFRDHDEALWRMTPQQAYWYKNALVLEEIRMWERNLSRS